jgi:hypothetical protein
VSLDFNGAVLFWRVLSIDIRYIGKRGKSEKEGLGFGVGTY